LKSRLSPDTLHISVALEDMTNKLNGAYEPNIVETEIYRKWEESGFFNPDNLKLKKGVKPFTIIMPPPNANGALHVGHALFVTLEDIMIRFQRMRGKKTLWLPGADHAGFETQVVFDKKLEKEGKKRSDFSRDELYQKIWDFTQENKKVMENQLRKLGASCDWSREKFTLDPDIVEKVEDTFIALYNDGLIYRGNRIVNWCVKHQTTLSDLEVRYEERTDPLYYVKYGPLELATVRPETKFGDTAVAVNPKDKRYKHLIGKEIEFETLLGTAKMEVIADEAVDPNFGTGVIKVTPAHDAVDFEIGKRHGLEVRQVIDKNGRLNERTGPYAGLKVAEARQKVAEDMLQKSILIKIDPIYKHNVAVCYKCGNIVEPLVMPQWYVATTKLSQNQKSKIKNQNVGKSLRDMAVEAVKSKQIKIIPKKQENIFFHWMKGLKDWNISRQITWGIRIPAWSRDNEIIVSKDKPDGENWVQDPDVLDTWFSSGQWPFLTLGYPDGKDYKTFYPTSIMETGYDIIFFWVARMMMLGLYRTGQVPFKTVYLHGLVRDKDRQKMSKSKGNVIDPLGVAETYGTDAVRMALVIGNTAGNDPIISEDKIRGYRNFANKIWNAARFVLMNISEKSQITNHPEGVAPQPYGAGKSQIKFTNEDKKRLKELDALVKAVTQDLENYRFHHAGEKLYHYFWHTFADKIIESAKPRLAGTDTENKKAAAALLLQILRTNLILLHPFMPYVTEAIWQKLPGKRKLLMIEQWPNA